MWNELRHARWASNGGAPTRQSLRQSTDSASLACTEYNACMWCSSCGTSTVLQIRLEVPVEPTVHRVRLDEHDEWDFDEVHILMINLITLHMNLITTSIKILFSMYKDNFVLLSVPCSLGGLGVAVSRSNSRVTLQCATIIITAWFYVRYHGYVSELLSLPHLDIATTARWSRRIHSRITWGLPATCKRGVVWGRDYCHLGCHPVFTTQATPIVSLVGVVNTRDRSQKIAHFQVNQVFFICESARTYLTSLLCRKWLV